LRANRERGQTEREEEEQEEEEEEEGRDSLLLLLHTFPVKPCWPSACMAVACCQLRANRERREGNSKEVTVPSLALNLV
jgi:hypothetical protein